MTDQRRCVICEEALPEGSRTSRKTCSDTCRSALARQRKNARLHAVDEAAKTAVSEVVKEQVREYVNREVLTEDLLGRIKEMVGLTVPAIEAIEDLMGSEDSEVALRAAQTILRYTMGNPSVAPPSLDVAPSPMSIQFNLPRPGDGVDLEVAQATEMRMCNDCHVAKPESDFVAGSSRCTKCFQEIQESVHLKLAPKDDRDHSA